MYYLGSRIEPHWVGRDGRRMILAAQFLDDHGVPVGRRFEARVLVLPDGMLVVGKKRMMRRRNSGWWVEAKSPEPPRRRQVFLLRPADPTIDSGSIAVTIPARSRAGPILDALLEQERRRTASRWATPPGRPNLGTDPSAS